MKVKRLQWNLKKCLRPLFAAAMLGVLSWAIACFAGSAGSLPEASPAATQPPATPAPTASPTPTPEPTPSGLCGDRYEVFTDGTIIETETSYQSKDCAIFLTRVHEPKSEFTGYRLEYYLFDVYVQDINDLRCAIAKESLYGRSFMKDFAQEQRAAFAISGDFAGWRKKGICVRNGEAIRVQPDKSRDIGVLYQDGTLAVFSEGEYQIEELLELDPWQVWHFGPGLLDENGKSKTQFNSDVYYRSGRVVFGYFEPGHYGFLLVCNKNKKPNNSFGITLIELSRLVESLGFTIAYNLDGGRTAQAYFNGQVYAAEAPERTRKINDIIYLPLAEE
ncbi:MAG: phosphodiester glycosidase family protein [Clostridiales bacterium]|nr:phosphodiester glycosidase family protein [Clostridiales bacterium]